MHLRLQIMISWPGNNETWSGENVLQQNEIIEVLENKFSIIGKS